MRPYVVLVLAVFWSVVCAAETPVALHAVLEPPQVPFHRAAALTVRLESPADLTVALPALPEKIDGLEITKSAAESTTTPEGIQVQTQRYTLDALHAGDFVLPSLTATWGEGKEAATPPLLFRARELTEAELSEAQLFQDIVLPMTLVQPERGTPWLLVGLIAGALAVGGALYALKLWRRAKEELQAPPVSAWETALRRLRDLEKKNLPELGKAGQYYVDLSSILRFYIEDRFHVHAPEQTTQEFLEAAAKSGVFSDEHQQLLAQFLRLADRVKFAQLEPAYEEMRQSFEAVKQFVHETVPKVAPVAQEAAAA